MTSCNAAMSDDYNRFDSFHPTFDHPRMTAAEWTGAYQQAWRDFYTIEGMKTILARANHLTYWGLFKNFVWYKYSIAVEATHPMICGFFRLKDRRQKRPGHDLDSRWAHLVRRTRDITAWLRAVGRLYFEMQEVWLATRGHAQFRENLDGWRRRYDEVRGRLGESAVRAGQALRGNVAQARAGLGSYARRFNPIAIHTQTRADLNAYWKQTRDWLRRGRIYRINPFRLALNLLRDVKLCVRFSLWFLVAYGK
jgi:hypothetical protein